MKKLFIVSDVHGFYDEMIKALIDAGFEKDNPDHIFVSLGDLLDRGKQPKECLSFVNSLPDDRKILIMGNHEILMDEMLHRGYAMEHDYHNRTINTVFDCLEVKEAGLVEWEQIQDLFKKFSEWEDWQKYYKSCINYWENKDNIFVHGWIPCRYRAKSWNGRIIGAEYDPDWRDKHWDQAVWYNGMDLWDQGVREAGKTIQCGHWHTSWGHAYLHGDGVEWLQTIETYHIDPETGRQEPHMNSDPFEDEGICAMDSCVAVTHHVNCKIIETDDLEMNIK